ncbi:hypothetical protein [Gemmatimonas sp.]|uniref:hypothetical protein n=1 Tax=Gemmatimonas sp. TaxID=1962908 RepID=UPI00333EC523
MIQSKTELRAAIQAAEMIAARLDYPAHRLTIGERRVIAQTLRDLADVARRAFDPYARNDWAAEPKEPTEADDAPGLFGEAVS